jgi:hypothetical protein
VNRPAKPHVRRRSARRRSNEKSAKHIRRETASAGAAPEFTAEVGVSELVISHIESTLGIDHPTNKDVNI